MASTPLNLARRASIGACLGVLLVLSGCATVSPEYSMLSVPEEGGIRFTRITTQEDNAIGPAVVTTGRGLQFSVLRPFDVSKDGATVAFISRRNGKDNIFVKSTAGGSATTQRTFRDDVRDPTFSPDGGSIAFADNRNGRLDIYAVSTLSGSAIRQVTRTNEATTAPVYAPDGQRIAYVEGEASAAIDGSAVVRYYVWEHNLETGSYTQFSEGYSPAYSPDGTKMVVVRNSRDHGNSEIWIVDLETGVETLIISDPEVGYSFPAFAPDGERLVITGSTQPDRNRPRNLDIYTLRTDGTNLTQLTFHPGHDFAGQFGPSPDVIYFLSTRGSSIDKYNVWSMQLR